jgi:hypothetical protein
VGHPGSEESNAGELFTPNHLPRAKPHLPVEVIPDLTKASGHAVERLCQLRHLIRGIQPDQMVEVPRGNTPGSIPQQP